MSTYFFFRTILSIILFSIILMVVILIPLLALKTFSPKNPPFLHRWWRWWVVFFQIAITGVSTLLLKVIVSYFIELRQVICIVKNTEVR